MSNANEVVVRYLAAWNEPEPKRRRELVAKAWTDDGTYVDAARDGKGHDSLDAMIAAAQGHFPATGCVWRAASRHITTTCASAGSRAVRRRRHSTSRAPTSWSWAATAASSRWSASSTQRPRALEGGRDGQEKCCDLDRRRCRRRPCHRRRPASGARTTGMTRSSFSRRRRREPVPCRLGHRQARGLHPCLGLNADIWEYQLVELADQGLRCVAYDRRGHGRSSHRGAVTTTTGWPTTWRR